MRLLMKRFCMLLCIIVFINAITSGYITRADDAQTPISILSFDTNTQGFTSNAPDNFRISASGNVEGDGCLAFDKANTIGGFVGDWHMVFNHVNASKAADTGRLSIKVYISDPSRVVTSGDLMLRIFLSSDGRGLRWDGTDNYLCWNINVSDVPANTWTTLPLNIRQPYGSGGNIDLSRINYTNIQFSLKGSSQPIEIRFDALKVEQTALQPADSDAVISFDGNTSRITSNAPDIFRISASGNIEGDGCLTFDKTNTDGGSIGDWYMVFNPVNATKAADTGRLSIKVYISDPSRVVTSGDLMLRIFLSSDGRGLRWDGTDNYLCWNINVSDVPANTWTTLPLNIGQPYSSGGNIDLSRINYTNIQFSLKGSSQPIEIRFDDLKVEQTALQPADSDAVISFDGNTNGINSNAPDNFRISASRNAEGDGCLVFDKANTEGGFTGDWYMQFKPVNASKAADTGRLSIKVYISDPSRVVTSGDLMLRIFLSSDGRAMRWDGTDNYLCWNVNVSDVPANTWTTLPLNIRQPYGSGGNIDLSRINYTNIQFSLKGSSQPIEIRLDDLKVEQTALQPADSDAVISFDGNTNGIISNAPDNFRISASGNIEGDGCLAFDKANTEGGFTGDWYMQFKPVNASKAIDTGRLSIKIFISDPSRVVTSGPLMLRILLSSDGRAMRWDGTDNYLCWNINVSDVPANTWTTLTLDIGKMSSPDKNGNIDYSHINYSNIQFSLSDSNQPFTIKIDDLRVEQTPPQSPDNDAIVRFDPGTETNDPNFKFLPSSNVEGTGCMLYYAQNTVEGKVLSWKSTFTPVDGSKALQGGRFSIKVFISDPSRIKNSGDIMLRLFLSSDNRNDISWDGNDNALYWNIPVNKIPANTWTTISLNIDEADILGKININNISFAKIQFMTKGSDLPFIMKFDDLKAELTSEDNTFLFGFNTGTSIAPGSGFSIDKNRFTEGDGSLKFEAQKTASGYVAAWESAIKPVDASGLINGNGGKFTLKVWVNDPLRIKQMDSYGVGLGFRIFLSSDGRSPIWLPGQDSLVCWNFSSMPDLKANEWNTISLNLICPEISKLGSLDFSNINYIIIQMCLVESDNPFLINFDELRFVVDPPDMSQDPSVKHIDHSLGISGDGSGGTPAKRGKGWDGIDRGMGWAGIDPNSSKIIRKFED